MRNRLKQARQSKGWTQAEVARRLGMTERAYRHLEAGTRNPSYETVKKLRKLFGIPDEELLEPDHDSTVGAEVKQA
ncbi:MULTISPECIES: helix-turn-helix transcriptional regulator [Alicyclobacillus]|uniref:helix-turn-helix transcriptional regulator n=1 Tax=Alicyclobacillus TaxID=29330 RepID=UPI0004964948|nr:MULTISPECIES: helix-turn-helix transcriptional regulator [Alicyclobacillus]MCL6516597.1 helix-turn-helix domain-containing protein [Alicyclobacillus sp.]